ncbi:MAG TPA: hypothetical protein VGK67_19420 [Myxococcales bacterium]
MENTTFFSEPEPGLFLVAYEDPRNMAPDLQGPLIAAMEKAAARGPIGVCFRVSDSIPVVKLEVPSFWLGITGRSDLQLRAMAIASRSVGVQLAAKGFALSNRIRKIPIEVQTFADMEEAHRWVRLTLDGGAGQAMPGQPVK